jgi:hypothetical protein
MGDPFNLQGVAGGVVIAGVGGAAEDLQRQKMGVLFLVSSFLILGVLLFLLLPALPLALPLLFILLFSLEFKYCLSFCL